MKKDVLDKIPKDVKIIADETPGDENIHKHFQNISNGLDAIRNKQVLGNINKEGLKK